MSAREGLEFETEIISDTAPLNGLVKSMIDSSKNIKMMRDITRGGLSSTLNEIASFAGVGIEIEEENIPINEEVIGACEILGFDPLYIKKVYSILKAMTAFLGRPVIRVYASLTRIVLPFSSATDMASLVRSSMVSIFFMEIFLCILRRIWGKTVRTYPVVCM